MLSGIFSFGNNWFNEARIDENLNDFSECTQNQQQISDITVIF